jgi:hypothetical protein
MSWFYLHSLDRLPAGSAAATHRSRKVTTRLIHARRACVMLPVMLLAAPSVQATEAPAAYCRHVGTDDTLRPIPPSLIPAAKRAFGLEARESAVLQSTSFRCMDAAVMMCTVGANLPCGKGDTNRSMEAATDYCRANPDATFIPAFVTGHATIYSWSCRGQSAIPANPVPLDARGFMVRVWKPAE